MLDRFRGDALRVSRHVGLQQEFVARAAKLAVAARLDLRARPRGRLRFARDEIEHLLDE